MFITFEGIDASGKSTQIQRLAEYLTAQGREFLLTKEPGGSAIGSSLRQILLDPNNHRLAPQAELLLYLADRIQHLQEVIRPALAAGRLVLCDRYHDATLAYQGGGRGLDLAWVKPFAKKEILKPDLTLWFDLDPSLARQRLESRAKEQSEPLCRLEQEDLAFFTRIRQSYQALAQAEPQRFVRIEADQRPELVEAEVRARLRVEGEHALF